MSATVSAFGAGHEATQNDLWDRQRGNAQLVGPYEVDTVISNGGGCCQPHRVDAGQSTVVVVLRSRLWQAGQQNRQRRWHRLCDSRMAIERGYELKLLQEKSIEGPYFVIALMCLVAERYAVLCSPQHPRRHL